MTPGMGVGGLAGPAGLDPSMAPLGGGRSMYLPDLAMLLAGTSFRWSLEGAEGARFTTWGRGSATRFDGRDEAVALRGEVVGGTAGVDIERGRLLAGLAVSHAHGKGDYQATESAAAGKIESTLTSLHPYLRASITDRLDAWGMLGYGRGGLKLGLGEGLDAVDTDLESRMSALGLRGELWTGGRFRLAGKTDALWSSTTSAATDGMVSATGDAGRARVALEGAAQFALGAHRFMPLVEIGARYDAGDAETGYGIELGVGLGYANAELGLTLETRGRVLLAHEDGGYEEWGASGSLRYAPGLRAAGCAWA